MTDLINIESNDGGLVARTKINNSFAKVNGLVDTTGAISLGQLVVDADVVGFPQDTTITTSEYFTGSGYGGNSYILIDGVSSRPADDGGSIIHVGNSFLYLKGLFPDGVNFSQFGAVGDYNPDLDVGTDDFDAINNAIQFSDNVKDESNKKFKVLDVIAKGSRLTLNLGEDTYIYQRDITKPLFDLDGMGGSSFIGGNYSHNMDIADYAQANGKLFLATIDVDDLSFRGLSIFKTAQQGITLNSGGKNFLATRCSFEETARDGIFLVDPVNPKVSFCTFKNTGDDSLVAARQAKGVLFTNNTIEGAGSYNLGGSSIRCNGSGVIDSNICNDSGVFGIIAAVNDDDATAKPFDLTISNNVIKGIAGTGVTAGIGIKEAINITCYSNDIEMPNNEAHAYRLYDLASDKVRISGGYVKNAKSVLYVRNGAASNINVASVDNLGCTDNVLVDSTGDIDRLTISGVNNYGVSSYFRASFSSTTTIGFLDTESNRTESESGPMFQYADIAISRHNSNNDQYSATESDNSNASGVGSITEAGKITL